MFIEASDIPDGVGHKRVAGVRDIYLAAYLQSIGKRFLGVKRGNGGMHSAFYFDDVTEEDVHGFYYTQNPAKDLFQCFKDMRNFSTHMVLDD